MKHGGFQTWKNGKVLFGSDIIILFGTLYLWSFDRLGMRYILEDADRMQPPAVKHWRESNDKLQEFVETYWKVKKLSLDSEPWGCPNPMEAFTKPVSQQEGSTRLYICMAAHGERENVPFSCLDIFWQGEFLFGGEWKHRAYWSHLFFCVGFGLAWCMGAGPETHSLTNSVVLFVQKWCLCQNQGNKGTCKYT